MPHFVAVTDPRKAASKGSEFDAVLLVGHDPAAVDLPPLRDALRAAAAADAKFASKPSLLPVASAAGGRLLVAPTGPLHRDHDDVRRHADAVRDGIRRARDAGARKILVLLQEPADPRYADAARVVALAALGALWEPLEAREALGEATVEPVQQVGLACLGSGAVDAEWITAVDGGLRIARDLGGTEPERMAPPRFAAYVKAAFQGTQVKVTVEADPAKLRRDYPLLHAVARASLEVPRHRPCVIRLEYTPKGKVARTLLFAGKGVTYDTGGADLKTGGGMAGMSRDKGGAAAVAGLVHVAAKLGLRGTRLCAELGVVRNSIGAESYVTDEIVRSHAGCRVRVGNTDAEGRLVLADLLSHLRVRAANEKGARLFSVATLTGHAGRAVGPYSIAIDNGPARSLATAATLMEHGDRIGDPFEISRLRREDFDFVQPKSRADDALSCNNQPSVATARGHQFPMAFLCLASGLAAHAGDSKAPLPFTHIDVGGCGVEGGDWQHGRPTGRPLLAMLSALCS